MNRRLAYAALLGLGLLGLAAPAAARYQDPTLRFSLELPPGWTARARPPGAPADNTVRLRPPRRTDRDRGQVRVDVWPSPVLKPAALARHLADIGSDDDAAVLARRPASARQPIHWTEYRIGMYGADGEWRIERRLEGVQALPGQTWHIRCTAAESEFRHYRYLLEGICLSFVPPKR